MLPPEGAWAVPESGTTSGEAAPEWVTVRVAASEPAAVGR